jgi:hypothetical protein
LQDYSDCPRRFQLRYVLDVHWPVAREDPIAQWERQAQLGAAFHRMVQQHAVGIPEQVIAATLTETELVRWWSNYLQIPPPEMPGMDTTGAQRHPEVRLTTPQGGPGSARYRLMARYDLLAVEPGTRAVIVDWKTNKRRPERTRLETRWQTRVYRYVLVVAGAQFNDNVSWTPDQVELIYWFANYPAQPERFPYDDAQYAEDEWILKTTIAEIATRARDAGSGTQNQEWTLTDDLTRCRYCTYRTLCDREKVDAEEPEWEPDGQGAFRGDELHPLDIDLEQIAEIEF